MSLNPNFPKFEKDDIKEENVEVYIKFDLERWTSLENELETSLNERIQARQYDFQTLRLLNALRIMHEKPKEKGGA